LFPPSQTFFLGTIFLRQYSASQTTKHFFFSLFLLKKQFYQAKKTAFIIPLEIILPQVWCFLLICWCGDMVRLRLDFVSIKIVIKNFLAFELIWILVEQLLDNMVDLSIPFITAKKQTQYITKDPNKKYHQKPSTRCNISPKIPTQYINEDPNKRNK
jgi:hypothetical protein